MHSRATNAAITINKQNYPDIDASSPLDDILWMFFKYDVVCIRNMLSPLRVKQFYETSIAPIYKQDDEIIASNYKGVAEWEKTQIATGWIGDDRLSWFSGGTATLEDPLQCHLYTRLVDRLMGTISWHSWPGLDCHAYRLSQRARLNQISHDLMSTELDALWLNDKQLMLNLWTPLSEGKNDSTHIELILATADEIKRHGQYTTTIADEPRGIHNTNPRLVFEQFTNKSLEQAFGPERRWAPELNIGDVIISSNWAAHKMCYPLNVKNDRVFLEYVVCGNQPDSPLRQIYSK